MSVGGASDHFVFSVFFSVVSQPPHSATNVIPGSRLGVSCIGYRRLVSAACTFRMLGTFFSYMSRVLFFSHYRCENGHFGKRKGDVENEQALHAGGDADP